MIGKKKIAGIGAITGIILIGLVVALSQIPDGNPNFVNLNDFPDFYTKTNDYYVTRIGSIPDIDGESYELSITGFIDNPRSFTLYQLQALPLIKFPLTIECIGNPSFGSLVSTANWTGFSIYNLLLSLGLKSSATGVKYYAADGYYATHTMSQLMNNTVIGALFINDQILPAKQGFPLRIINPGYYGAKQPAWVVQIEVIDMPLTDYWDDRGWDTSPKMRVDSKIFFPGNFKVVNSSDTILIGGAAFGGTRISKVEYSINNGVDWSLAEIVKSVDIDNVWVFWLIGFTISGPGNEKIYVKATDIHGQSQPRIDGDIKDGDSSWPSITLEVI